MPLMSTSKSWQERRSVAKGLHDAHVKRRQLFLRRKRQNEKTMQRYHNDPEFRAKFIARSVVHKPYSEWSEEQKAKRNEKKRLHRLTGKSTLGGKPAKHDAHVKLWSKLKQKTKGLSSRAAKADQCDAHVREFFRCHTRRDRYKRQTDAGYVLNMRLRVAIRKAMRGNKGGRKWEQLVGYSLDELMRHFERMLPKGVSIEKAVRDGWHIDHITPKSLFDLSDEDQLKAAWCISNLRLVPANTNLSKGSNRIYLL